MDYRIVVVVAAVALAGCSIGGTAGPATQTPAADAVSYPAGFAESGTTDVNESLANHRSALLNASNYSARWQFVESANGTVVSNITVSGELSPRRNESLFTITERGPAGKIDGYHQQAYYANGSQHTYSLADEKRLGSVEREFSSLVFVYGDRVRRALTRVELNATGVDRSGRTAILTYEVTGPSERATNETEDATGTVRVSADGRLVSVDVSLVRSGGTGTIRYTVSKVGATTVDRPDWFTASG